jgi:m7GpppX diphosphatase
VLYGHIEASPAVLTVERAALSNDESVLSPFASELLNIKNLGDNDIYRWYLASTAPSTSSPDVKLNLIYPCTETHVKKYSRQGVRMVTETPEIYSNHMRPYMQKKREEGRLNWVWNIIEGRTEQEDVLYRETGDEGFLVLPDL